MPLRTTFWYISSLDSDHVSHLVRRSTEHVHCQAFLWRFSSLCRHGWSTLDGQGQTRYWPTHAMPCQSNRIERNTMEHVSINLIKPSIWILLKLHLILDFPEFLLIFKRDPNGARIRGTLRQFCPTTKFALPDTSWYLRYLLTWKKQKRSERLSILLS